MRLRHVRAVVPDRATGCEDGFQLVPIRFAALVREVRTRTDLTAGHHTGREAITRLFCRRTLDVPKMNAQDCAG